MGFRADFHLASTTSFMEFLFLENITTDMFSHCEVCCLQLVKIVDTRQPRKRNIYTDIYNVQVENM